MNTHKENFKHWFCDIIQSLYKNENAGFAILMLTFPLLERYLRSKSGITYDKNFSDACYKELIELFPVLKDNKNAATFWIVYRHGILHQATFSPQNRKGDNMPDGWLSGDTEAIEIHSNGSLWLNPVKFAEVVIAKIYRDFSTFEASNSSGHPPLATARKSPEGFNGTCGYAERKVLHSL
jgi:hypothetical protein